MKILVTGSSGHLGAALVLKLQEENHTVIGIDIKASKTTTEIGSITDSSFVQRCMQGVEVVLHTATLHKPHIVTHSKQQFIDVNISGTNQLLEASIDASVKAFIFTSSTSAYGHALTPKPEGPATWITEQVTPIPKNIYGVTKLAAEDLCWLFHKKHQLPCLILKTSRFFPEMDDNEGIRKHFSSENAKANELLFRRVDIEDAVSAHIKAMEKAGEIGFGRYIISATSPFTMEDLEGLKTDPWAIVKRIFEQFEKAYSLKRWKMFESIDRVYVNDKARTELDWTPKYDFEYLLDSVISNRDHLSPLSIKIGMKGYHDQNFEDGPYPTE